MFRRRRQTDGPGDEPQGPESLEGESLEAMDDEGEVGIPVDGDESSEPALREGGPWDAEEFAESPDDVERVDLGGMRIPVRTGVDLRIDATAEGAVVSATMVSGASAVQVNAFAAPRSAGIWDEVRAEIAQSIAASGGSSTEGEGRFGTELRARVPTDAPGQGRVLQPVRFVGVDGPRWFLRGLFSGPAATDQRQAALLEGLFAEIVVVRGKDAMAPRDAIPLNLPRGVGGPQAGPEQGAEIVRLERGPEIAETR